jgi:phosphatidylinositol alpha-1,6-mannosyltransferase
MADRLARGMGGFQTTVVTPGLRGAEQSDRRGGLEVTRTRPGRGSGRLSLAALNVGALRVGLRVRAQAVLSLHIVASPAAAALRRVRAIPSVQYFHANEIPDKPRLTRFAVAHADAVVAVSAYTAQLVAAAGAAPARLALIPPGVDLPHNAEPARNAHPTVLTIARLDDRYKGHDVLARALVQVRASVPQVRWVVIGEGSLRGELERLAAELGLGEAARFLGAVKDAERDGWLASCDLLAMPSRLPADGRAGEGFGIAYLEAGAHGKPVVAGKAAGALDAVADGKTGLLVDPTDAAAVAGAIESLLRDPQLCARLGGAGAERARELAWPRIAARVEALLLERLEAAGRTRAGHRRPGDDAQAGA